VILALLLIVAATACLVSFKLGQSGISAPYVLSPRPKNGGAGHRKLGFSIAFLLVVLSPIAFMSPAEAALSDTMRDIFDGALTDFVIGIMNDTGNPIYTWSWMMFLALSVLLIFIEVVKFIFDGFDAASHLEAVIYFFITLGLMGTYDAFTSAIWGVGVGLSNGYQEYLVGNSDNFFLAQWLIKALGAVVLAELSFWDSFKLIQYLIAWSVVCFLLEIVFWLASMWAEFGYALAKVIGMIFIPFLLLPATRALFDGWFKFLCGFVVLLIMLKATMVVAAISIKAVLESLGVRFAGDYGDPTVVVNIAKENLYMLSDCAAILVIAVLFVLSSFVFASMIASGVGNLSGGLGSVTKLASRRILKGR